MTKGAQMFFITRGDAQSQVIPMDLLANCCNTCHISPGMLQCFVFFFSCTLQFKVHVWVPPSFKRLARLRLESMVTKMTLPWFSWKMPMERPSN